MLIAKLEIDAMRDLVSARKGVERACQIGHATALQFFESKGSSAMWAHDHIVKFVKREPRRGRVGPRFRSAGIAVPNIDSCRSNPLLFES